MSIAESAAAAKQASILLAAVPTQTKNNALAAIVEALRHRSGEIAAANGVDVDRARAENLATPLLKRLRFDEGKIHEVCEGIESLIRLADPVGRTLSDRKSTRLNSSHYQPSRMPSSA